MISVRRGITRTVILTRRHAIKVPTTRPGGLRQDRMWAWARGILANHSEREWSEIEGVAPVLRSWFGGIVQVYPRCQPVEGDVGDRHDDRWWRAIAPDLFHGDRKASNLGILDGRTVWIDYDSSWNGCPHTPWNETGE